MNEKMNVIVTGSFKGTSKKGNETNLFVCFTDKGDEFTVFQDMSAPKIEKSINFRQRKAEFKVETNGNYLNRTLVSIED